MENESSKTCLPSDECTNDLDLFFANGLYNSCQATDKLIKSIEESHDEALARRALDLYQRHYSSLDRPWNHVTLMYGLGLIYMHFNAYNWATKAFREVIYVEPSFARSHDIHTRLGLIFKSKGRYKLSEKHFNLAINDTRPSKGTSTKQELEFHKDSGISSQNSSTHADCASVPSQNSNGTLMNYISAEQVIEACLESPKPRKIDINVLIDEDKPPHMFPKPPPYPPLSQDKLFPSPPSIFLETKKDLTTKRIQDCCQSNPISIVRNIASVLKLDLGLFSTKTLVETNPDHAVDILSHLFHQPGESIDENSNENLWACQRQKSSSTILRYASYQVNSFRNSLQEERDSKSSGSRGNPTKGSETDSNESASAQAKRLNINNQSSSQPSNESHLNNQASNSGQKKRPNKKLKKEPPLVRDVKSASRIDLSDDKKWRPQLNELNKLPNFMKCVSASNMLTHIGSPVPGVNTSVMSMHVPGCRILGNKTLNNFCSVNINTGPGDYEWCAVSRNYGSILTRLCNRNGFELSGDGWWPKISDLLKYNIPIYRFSQRPGDLVWVNSGTIYWVQATGWCNNISWSTGPLTAPQYKSASESFELNKLIFQKSDVPMIQLTWNIIININYIADDDLCYAIIGVLRRSLRYCVLVKELIDEAKQTIQQLDVQSGPNSAKFCSLCEAEAFNIYFIRKYDDCLHCVECARRFDPTLAGYEIKQDYNLSYLMNLYDNFIETKKKFQSRGQVRQDQ